MNFIEKKELLMEQENDIGMETIDSLRNELMYTRQAVKYRDENIRKELDNLKAKLWINYPDYVQDVDKIILMF